MWKKCPKQIRKKAGLVFVCGWDIWDLYDQYLSDKTVKYSDNTKVNEYRFKGKRIVPIVGIPEHTIVLGEFTTGMESNLWMGVDYANDAEVVKVERLQQRIVFLPDANENGCKHRSSGRNRSMDRLQKCRITN